MAELSSRAAARRAAAAGRAAPFAAALLGSAAADEAAADEAAADIGEALGRHIHRRDMRLAWYNNTARTPCFPHIVYSQVLTLRGHYSNYTLELYEHISRALAPLPSGASSHPPETTNREPRSRPVRSSTPRTQRTPRPTARSTTLLARAQAFARQICGTDEQAAQALIGYKSVPHPAPGSRRYHLDVANIELEALLAETQQTRDTADAVAAELGAPPYNQPLTNGQRFSLALMLERYDQAQKYATAEVLADWQNIVDPIDMYSDYSARTGRPLHLVKWLLERGARFPRAQIELYLPIWSEDTVRMVVKAHL